MKIFNELIENLNKNSENPDEKQLFQSLVNSTHFIGYLETVQGPNLDSLVQILPKTFQEMTSSYHKRKFLTQLASLNSSTVSKRIIDALLEDFDTFLAEKELLPLFKPWTEIVANHIHKNLSVCDSDQLEALFVAMEIEKQVAESDDPTQYLPAAMRKEDYRQPLIQSISSLLGQKPGLHCSRWLQQDQCKRWQTQIMIREPQLLVAAISHTTKCAKIDAVVKYMNSEERDKFEQAYPTHSLNDDENLDHFIKHTYGYNIFISKMRSLGEQAASSPQDNWLKQHPARAQLYFKHLVQLQANLPYSKELINVLQSFLNGAKSHFKQVEFICGQETRGIPIECLRALGTLDKRAREPRSKSFYNMLDDLDASMEQLPSLEVHCDDAIAFKIFCDYLQWGQLPDCKNMSVKSKVALYKLAHHYDAKNLSEACLVFFEEACKNDLHEILQISIASSLYDLIYLCTSYMWDVLSKRADVPDETPNQALKIPNSDSCDPKVEALMKLIVSLKECIRFDRWVYGKDMVRNLSIKIPNSSIEIPNSKAAFSEKRAIADKILKPVLELDKYLNLDWNADIDTSITLCLSAIWQGNTGAAQRFLSCAKAEELEKASYRLTDLVVLYKLAYDSSQGKTDHPCRTLIPVILVLFQKPLRHRYRADNLANDIAQTFSFLSIESDASKLESGNCSFFAKYPEIFADFLENYPALLAADSVLPIFKEMDWSHKNTFFEYLTKNKITHQSEYQRTASSIFDQILDDLFHQRDLFQNCPYNAAVLTRLLKCLNDPSISIIQFFIQKMDSLDQPLFGLLFKNWKVSRLLNQEVRKCFCDHFKTGKTKEDLSKSFMQWIQGNPFEWQIEVMCSEPDILFTPEFMRQSDYLKSFFSSYAYRLKPIFNSSWVDYPEEMFTEMMQRKEWHTMIIEKMQYCRNKRRLKNAASRGYSKDLFKKYFKFLCQIHMGDVKNGGQAELIYDLTSRCTFIDRVTLYYGMEEITLSSLYLSLLSPVLHELLKDKPNNCRVELTTGMTSENCSLFFQFLKTGDLTEIDLSQFSEAYSNTPSGVDPEDNVYDILVGQLNGVLKQYQIPESNRNYCFWHTLL